MTTDGRILALERQLRRIEARLGQAEDDLKDAVDQLARTQRRVEVLEAAAARAGIDLEDDELTDESEFGEAGA